MILRFSVVLGTLFVIGLLTILGTLVLNGLLSRFGTLPGVGLLISLAHLHLSVCYLSLVPISSI